MPDDTKFRLLRRMLKGLGLQASAVDDIIDRIIELLSNAEFEFYRALRVAIGESVTICPKVSLGDLFYTKSGDYAQNLTARNHIERKHVDFLLCDPTTMRPLMGIELDDKSNQREDRKERDRLINGVFEAAGLPLQGT